MFSIFDYDLEQALDIIKNCGDIRIIDHVLNNWFHRSIDFNYIEKCICNKIPLGITKTRENRFKLIYPDKNKTMHDLYIIIEITDNREIEVVTAYPFKEDRRLRERETQ
ncbi:hypothetical protein SDC9_03512 [bioreactor metagenome]|uniref:Uncharacterized protein n=1 Tax=bioreactor metagenome TaxID=1076179 RepID=A0A644SUN9_9ZZZZ|nr:hypothetical protein [Methanobrevibacter sp.]MEA4956131.1 hypothetical protein [Methanobrevibacter sp.]